MTRTIACTLFASLLALPLASCGEAGLDTKAAKDLLAKAMEHGKSLLAKLEGIKDEAGAEAAKSELGTLVNGFTDVQGKVKALPEGVRSALSGVLGDFGGVLNQIKDQAAKLLENPKVKAILGGVLEKLKGLSL